MSDEEKKINLLQETYKELRNNGIKPEDILWVRCDKFSITVQNFRKIANKTWYYGGYGGVEIVGDLIVGGGLGINLWWMDRQEYDGSEWWEFHRITDILPMKRVVEIHTLRVQGYVHGDTLEESEKLYCDKENQRGGKK